MNTAKVEVALRRNICNVGGNLFLLTQLPYHCGRIWIVNGDHDHVCIVEVGGFEHAVDMCDLLLGNSVGDFFVQTRGRTDDRNVGVGIETVEDATGSDLL